MHSDTTEFSIWDHTAAEDYPPPPPRQEGAPEAARTALDRGFLSLRLANGHCLALQDELDHWISEAPQPTPDGHASPAQQVTANWLAPEARSGRAAAYLDWARQAQLAGEELLRRAAEAGADHLVREIERRAHDLWTSSLALLEADVRALARWQMEAMRSWSQFLREEGVGLSGTVAPPAAAAGAPRADDEDEDPTGVPAEGAD